MRLVGLTLVHDCGESLRLSLGDAQRLAEALHDATMYVPPVHVASNGWLVRTERNTVTVSNPRFPRFTLSRWQCVSLGQALAATKNECSEGEEMSDEMYDAEDPLYYALKAITGSSPPQFCRGIYSGSELGDRVVELHDWCAQHAMPIWSTGIGTLEAAELIVREAVANGNIAPPPGHRTPTLRVPVTALEADPPWRHGDKLPGPKRGAEKHYAGGTMTVSEICRTKLPALAKDCWLFLWTLHTHRREALVVAEAWGFSPTVNGEIVWEKTTKSGEVATGMGHTVRMAHEVCLIFKRGRPVRASASVKSVIRAERREHSRKPDEFYEQVVKFTGPDAVRAALFARREIPGFHCFGDEIGAVE